jgi:poly-gamma-glutamate capsule biosynthesis protein CapA/YwtB (metallophosphatase superfamily)
MNENDIDYAFEHLRPHLEGDALMGNLEAPVIAQAGDNPLRPEHPHRMRPRHLPALSDVGFTLLHLANDHTMDQGGAALEETLEHLAEEDIAWVGAGPDLEAARRAVIFDAGHTKVAVLGVYPPSSTFRKLGYYATEDSPGINPMNQARLAEDVRRLKQHADVVMLSVQWGRPYRDAADRQRELAQIAADAGVDVIHGHGAHRAQEVELVDGMPVVFGVGNLTTGDPGSYEKKSPKMKLSCIARYLFRDGKLDSVELLPIRTNNPKIDYQPQTTRQRHAKREFEPRLDEVEWTRRDDGWYVVDIP